MIQHSSGMLVPQVKISLPQAPIICVLQDAGVFYITHDPVFAIL